MTELKLATLLRGRPFKIPKREGKKFGNSLDKKGDRYYSKKVSMKNLFLTIIFITFSSMPLPAIENAQAKPFFQASKEQPYHLSIGAVLFNKEGLIACHHFKEIFGYQDIYILMRESMENNETPLMTLHRGLKEEFGATARPIAFLGCLSGYLPDSHLSFEKTTLYIVCQLIDWHPENRDFEDPEAGSTIKWLEPNVLISLMKDQGIRFQHRADADESEMIKRAFPYIEHSLNRGSGYDRNIAGCSKECTVAATSERGQ